MSRRGVYRIILGVVSVSGLLLTYLFQRLALAQYLQLGNSETVYFIVNRSVRFVLNDIFAIGLIYALFPFRRYLMFSLAVQVFGTGFFLLPYFILKIILPHYNGPMISFLHRIVLNPILMLLLIPAFYYQQLKEKQKN
jgi:exosortase F-associated protein